jgi:hypothetical protein
MYSCKKCGGELQVWADWTIGVTADIDEKGRADLDNVMESYDGTLSNIRVVCSECEAEGEETGYILEDGKYPGVYRLKEVK